MLPSLSLRYAHDSCLIVASAPLTLLRIAIPNPAGLVEVLHIVFIPSAAQAKAAAIRRFGRYTGVFTHPNDDPSVSSSASNPSRPDNYLPLRRADDASVPPVSSARSATVRSQVAPPHQVPLFRVGVAEGRGSLYLALSVAPSLTHKTPIPLTFAANTSSRTP